MSYTPFATSNALTSKEWSQRTIFDFVSDVEMLGQMIKSGVIRRQDELSRGQGDRITVPFLNRLVQPGFIGNAAVTNSESPLIYSSDAMYIDQLRQVAMISADYTIDVQRASIGLDFSEDTYRVLSEWHKVRGILGVFNQLAGNTATTLAWDGYNYSGNDRLQLTGLNAAIAPSTNSGVTRILRANNLSTDELVAADTTATMKISNILQAETVAQTIKPYIREIDALGEIKYHCYVHTQQYNNLIQDTTSPIQYRDIQQSLITSGRGEGQIARSFVISQTRVFNSDKLPLGVNSSTSAAVDNCRRAIFCGRDAGAMAFGRGFSDGKDSVAGFRIQEDYVDVGQQRRIGMSGIYGIKKLQFTDQGSGTPGVPNDNGVIVISTYSSI